MKQTLVPAETLANANRAHFPNESPEYRRARNALLAEEIELRRHLERVAEMRRQLPPGGVVTKDYRFEGEAGPASCTSFMATWEKKMADIEQRVAFVMVARSPIARILEAKASRGWKSLKMFSDPSGDYTRDYVSAEDADMPGYSVFTRKDGTIRHFWSGEMGGETADPGQDPRGAPDFDPLWILLDTTPGGRGTDWYPKLNYGGSA